MGSGYLTKFVVSIAAIAVLMGPVDAEARKKKKDKKKDKAPTETTTNTASPAAGSTLAGPSRQVEVARGHLLAFETDRARQALEGVGTQDAWAVSARGWLLQQEGDFNAAAAEHRRAADMDPRNPVPLLHLGEALTYAQKSGVGEAYSEAEKRARQLLAETPDDVAALAFLGIAQQGRKAFDESAETLTKAQRLAPEDSLVRFHLGVAYFYQQRWQQAFDELGAAIERRPGIALAYYYRGLAAGKLDRKDLLYNDLDRFVRMAPKAPEADYARRLLASFG